MSRFPVGPESYLEEIAAAKSAVSIPIIASLNGSTIGGWTDYAKRIEEAGADAVELNIYWIPTDFERSGDEVERRYLEILAHVKRTVGVSVAVKVSPFFQQFCKHGPNGSWKKPGAQGLVLFNRFYQPDIDLQFLEVKTNLALSTPMAMRLPLRWIAILYGRIKADLAGTSGIHQATDVVKMLMAGADVTMICSILIRKGIAYIADLERELAEWLEINEYDSVEQIKGTVSQRDCAVPEAFERAQYMRAIAIPSPRA